MKILAQIERRLQDLERRMENKQRLGEVKDVKFDDELKRWFVKYIEHPDGADAQESDDRQTVLSDWIPWQTFANDAIRVSMPPRKGQRVQINSPSGEIERAVASPYHNAPDAESPHDKEDEYVIEFRDPQDKSKVNRIHQTKDNTTMTLGESSWNMVKDTIDATVGSQKITVTPQASMLTNQLGRVALDLTGKIISKNVAGITELLPDGTISLVNKGMSRVVLMARGILRLNT